MRVFSRAVSFKRDVLTSATECFVGFQSQILMGVGSIVGSFTFSQDD